MQPEDNLPPTYQQNSAPVPPPTPPPQMPVPVTPPEPPQPSQIGNNHSSKLEQLDKGERLITVIRRHFFGIFVIYVQTALALTVGIGLIYFLLPNFVDQAQENIYRIVGIGAAVIVVLMVIMMILATLIYYSSKIIVTDRHITQVIQGGLFRRKVSQLDISNIEDVNATRKGLFATVLNYGILNIETAGTAENFTFHYCPKPDYYAKQILDARESVRRYRMQAKYNDPYQPYS